jgi:hypothetical protein
MAGNLVSTGQVDQLGLRHCTLWHGDGTAGMEVATRWRIESTGYLAGKDNLLCRLIGMGW